MSLVQTVYVGTVSHFFDFRTNQALEIAVPLVRKVPLVVELPEM
jgi:hypothetical protein